MGEPGYPPETAPSFIGRDPDARLAARHMRFCRCILLSTSEAWYLVGRLR